LGLLASAFVLASALWTIRNESHPLLSFFLWAGPLLSAGVAALYSTFSHRRAQREAEAEAAKQRAAASEQLALSEQRRVRSERLATLGQLAASVAHEINNPIATVKMNLSCLKQELEDRFQPLPPELAELLSETHAGVDRIRQIADDLRTSSREDSGALEICAPAEVLGETIRLASARLKKSQIQVHQNIPAELPKVLANRRQLSQVFLNLLVNAADAADERAKKEPAQVRIAASAVEDQLAVYFEDNGPGIPESVLPRLFEPFFTTKPPGKGTGLGLCISREFIERFGGSLRAENIPGGGARFVVELAIRQ
jgi:C4-dicarboxylate-specific signal transduction histidine kinase